MGSIEYQDLTIQRRFLKRWGICTLIHKDSTHEEPHIHLNIWIRNDAIVNEEDDEAKNSRTWGSRSLPTKQTNISVQLSFHDIVWLYICLYSVDGWVFCIYTTKLHIMGKKSRMVYNIHDYLSRLKPLCWHIRSCTNS